MGNQPSHPNEARELVINSRNTNYDPQCKPVSVNTERQSHTADKVSHTRFTKIVKNDDSVDKDSTDGSTTEVNRVFMAKVKSLALANSSSTEKTPRNSLLDKKKVKRRFILFRKRQKIQKPVVTTGLTMKVDSNHNILVYCPKKSTNEENNSTPQSKKEVISAAALPDKYTKIFGEQNKSPKTKLVVKDLNEVRNVISIKSKGRKDCYIDSSVVAGLQLYVMRHFESQGESFPQSFHTNNDGVGGFVSYKQMSGMNILKPTLIGDEQFQNLLILCKKQLVSSNKSKAEETEGTGQIYDLNGKYSSVNDSKYSKILAAFVPRGLGKQTFLPERVLNSTIPPVDDMICVDQESHVYVCDIGLSDAQCDFIVDTTERCSRGYYTAYTYAKQTLGCRDHDELAAVCEWPVMRAYSSIITHLERLLKDEEGKAMDRTLVLDDREPHLVKYDTSKKERQKLDMHTDKSEWTFIIALSNGDGDDYDAGGTYIECLDTTIYLQKGHALIFPGKRRHRGQKIVNGTRFLLVGFLVENKEGSKINNNVEHDDCDDYFGSIL